ncbi:hypothetical protein B7463_g11412, partial [Scytalidium lignicola]
MEASPLPSTYQLPVHQRTPGSLAVKVLLACILSYAREIYDRASAYPDPTPLVPGSSAGRPDEKRSLDLTRYFSPGQLILVNVTIYGRDDPTSMALSGIHEGLNGGSKNIMRDKWRDSTYTECTKVPLENFYALSKARLLGKSEEGTWISPGGSPCVVTGFSRIQRARRYLPES